MNSVSAPASSQRKVRRGRTVSGVRARAGSRWRKRSHHRSQSPIKALCAPKPYEGDCTHVTDIACSPEPIGIQVP
jgi:hypothetical protein